METPGGRNQTITARTQKAGRVPTGRQLSSRRHYGKLSKALTWLPKLFDFHRQNQWKFQYVDRLLKNIADAVFPVPNHSDRRDAGYGF